MNMLLENNNLVDACAQCEHEKVDIKHNNDDLEHALATIHMAITLLHDTLWDIHRLTRKQ